MAVLSGQLFISIGYSAYVFLNSSIDTFFINYPNGFFLNIDFRYNLSFLNLHLILSSTFFKSSNSLLLVHITTGFRLSTNLNLFVSLSEISFVFNYTINGLIFCLGQLNYGFILLNTSIIIIFTNISFLGFSSFVNIKNISFIVIAFKFSFYIQYLSVFERFFGIGSKQDKNNIYIQKSSLHEFNPKLDNTAESLFIALIIQALQRESNYYISKVFIELWKTEFISVNDSNHINYILLINFFRLLPNAFPQEDTSITPNNI